MEQTTNLDGLQYVIFNLDNEEFGVDIHNITTIERLVDITRVPRTLNYVRGVMSLRGEIIPVIDLRKRFGLPKVDQTEDTRIIIFKVEDIIVGMIVDAVTEVVIIPAENIESVGSIANDHLATYIYGVGKINDRIITLLNLESLIGNTQEVFEGK